MLLHLNSHEILLSEMLVWTSKIRIYIRFGWGLRSEGVKVREGPHNYRNTNWVCVWGDSHKEPPSTLLQSIRGSEPWGRHSATSVHISTSAPSSPPSIPFQLKPFFPFGSLTSLLSTVTAIGVGAFHPKRHLSLSSTWFLLFYQNEGGEEEGEVVMARVERRW